AIRQYQAARDAWAEVARLTKDVYVSDITFGPERQLRGSWSERLAAIDQDVERLAKMLENVSSAAAKSDQSQNSAKAAFANSKNPEMAMQAVMSPRRQSMTLQHERPLSFRPGEALTILASSGNPAGAGLNAVRLHYRHVNQAEEYQVASMQKSAQGWSAGIPANYTNSPFPLQYFFELDTAAGSCLFPSLGAHLCDQPYFVVRQS